MNADFSYFSKGNENGVLLIHGLTGTPNEMKIVANGLNKAGFTTYCLQLAGHCGTEQDLCNTTWRDWYESVEKAADFLAERVDKLFVAGLSMGALLALKLAADRPNQIKGVAAYATTFFYDGWAIPFWVKHLYFLTPYVKKINLFQKYAFNERHPYGIKDSKIRQVIVRDMFSGDSKSAGLARNPMPALAEMLILSSRVQKELNKVTSPCLIMHSLEDDISNINTNALLIRDKINAPSKLVVLDDSYHLITIDKQRKKVINESVDFFTHLANEPRG